MANFDDMKIAVEALTGGKNTVILDDKGMPSIMVALPKMLSSELDESFTQETHPAWKLSGTEKDVVWLSKYQNIVIADRAYSLPLKDPKTSINFNTAVNVCRNKGTGWGLTPFSLWSAVALWCKKNGTMPRGNNNYGKDHAYAHEKGVPTAYDSGNVTRIATGSGPATWNHNWLPDGIADLNGNVWEWCAGMRLLDGEIQIIPYANSMDANVDMSATSADWKAIAADGTIVSPGTAGTLKYEYGDNKVKVCSVITTSEETGRGCPFESMGTDLDSIPQILKELALYPNGTGYASDYFYEINQGERLPVRGGYWLRTGSAGVFNVDLGHVRTAASGGIGFRSAFYGAQ